MHDTGEAQVFWCLICLSLHKQDFPGLFLVRRFKEKKIYQQQKRVKSQITSEKLTHPSP